MTLKDYPGFYYMMEMLLEVREENGELLAAMPGVPDGFEIRLEPLGGDEFLLHGGPVNGSTSAFRRKDNGEVTAIQVGDFELARISAEKAQTFPVVERLLAPPLQLTEEKRTAFEGLLAGILNNLDGGWIDYDMPYPKHEFVQYVMGKDIFIFHGSGEMDIETFQPVRTSVELYDKLGIGNLQAVYGTHDGLWSMFFAVVDRPKLKGSIRNGVNYFNNRDRETLAIYNFSINKEQLAEKPWRAGALYLLPRETFKRQWLTDVSPANEWASHVPVKPVAKLHLAPEDFPFLDRIGGHDDSIMIRLEALARAVRTAALSASLDDALFTVTIPDSDQNRSDLADLIEIQKVMIPAANFETEEKDGVLRLIVRGLPPAFRQVYGKMYAELLS